MILELIKKAGTMELSLSFFHDGNALSCDVVDSNDVCWYSYSSIDQLEVVNMINDYITNPVSFSQRFMDSIGEVDEIVLEEIKVEV
jgi:hypothetical protein